MDYTQRTNKLAHHVALSESERTAGGPASALAEPGFCVTRWESGPQVFPQGRLPVQLVRPLERCRAWRALAGDAGWAGVLAEGAISRPPRTATVIFSPGQEMLPLVVEALALVPLQKRWEVTFSTYFTRLPAGLECQWRFVLAGSPEANAARANPHALVIDLTRSSGEASGGRLVEAARTGVLPEAEVARQAPAAAATQSVPAEGFAVTAPHQTSSLAPQETEGRVYALRDRDEPKSVDIGFKAVARASPSATSPPKSSALKWTLFAAAALIATIGLFGGGTAAVYYFFGEHAVPVVTDPSKTPPKETPKTLDQPQKPVVVKNSPPAKSEPVASKPVPRDPAPRVTPRPDDKVPKPVKKPAPIAMVPKPEPDPFESIKKRKKLLRFPPLPDFGSSTAPQKLVDLSVSDPKRLQWRLLGAHQVFDEKAEFEITPVPSSTKTDSPTWTVNRQVPTATGSDKVLVGTLFLKSGELQYSWDSDVRRRPGAVDINKLRYCPLEISYGPEKKVVVQFDPQNAAVDDMKLSTGNSIRKTVGVLENAKLDKNDRPPLENLLVKVRDLKVARQPEGVTIKRLQVTPLSLHGSKSATFRFVHSKAPNAEPGQPLLELQIDLLEAPDADIKFAVTLNGFSRSDPLLTTKNEPATKFDERAFAEEKKRNESELKRCKKKLHEVEGYHVPSKEELDLRLEIKRCEENKRWFDRVTALHSALNNSTTLSFELCLPIEDGLPEVLVLKSHGYEGGDHTSARNGGT
jgi:hypothetical protein